MMDFDAHPDCIVCSRLAQSNPSLQAQRELRALQQAEEVAKIKARLQAKRPWFPWRITIERK